MFAALLTVGMLSAPRPGRPRPEFLHAVRSRLYIGSRPFRNVGVNIPDLFERFLAGDDKGATTALRDAAVLDARVVRCFGSTWGPERFGVFVNNRSVWFDAWDRLLAAASANGIAAVPSLLFNIRMIPEYLSAHGSTQGVVDLLTPGTPANGLASEYVTAMASRYASDPRVLMWEIGNEYNLEADLSTRNTPRPVSDAPTSTQVHRFLIQMATAIRTVDRNHAVTSGCSDMRPAAFHMRTAMLSHAGNRQPWDYDMDWTGDSYGEYTQMLAYFNPPPCTVVSVHEYGNSPDTPRWMVEDESAAFILPWTARACDEIGMPLFVGEFGAPSYESGKEIPAPWTVDFLQRMARETAPLATIWSWEFGAGAAGQDTLSLSLARTPALSAEIQRVNLRIDDEIDALAAGLGLPAAKRVRPLPLPGSTGGGGNGAGVGQPPTGNHD